ncbi:MAG: hypothetical protein HUU12_04305 [Anaerolineales bacterium]|nr:hypothetical protein [Anaerolineales bacterium]
MGENFLTGGCHNLLRQWASPLERAS